MHCPALKDIPAPPPDKIGWPWTEETPQLSDTGPNGKPWPRVSIVMPSFNQGRFIEESIRSVLLQGYPDLEFIIIDGGSTDDSVEIIEKYEKWLAYWVSEPDRGQSHAINKGLARCTGKFFNWHNADDVLNISSLNVMASAFIDKPDYSLVHGYVVLIDTNSSILYHYYYDKFLLKKTGDSIDVSWCFKHLKSCAQPGSLMDRELVTAVNGCDEKLAYNMDTELFLKLIAQKPSFYVHFPASFFRSHSNSKTTKEITLERGLERLYIARKIYSNRNLPVKIQKCRLCSFSTAHFSAYEGFVNAQKNVYSVYHASLFILYLFKSRQISKIKRFILANWARLHRKQL